MSPSKYGKACYWKSYLMFVWFQKQKEPKWTLNENANVYLFPMLYRADEKWDKWAMFKHRYSAVWGQWDGSVWAYIVSINYSWSDLQSLPCLPVLCGTDKELLNCCEPLTFHLSKVVSVKFATSYTLVQFQSTSRSWQEMDELNWIA